jgi:hypothetical protein
MTAPRDVLGRPVAPGAEVVYAPARARAALGRGLVLAVEPCACDRKFCGGLHVWIRAAMGWHPEARPRTVCVRAPGRLAVVPGALSPPEREAFGRHRFRPRRRYLSERQAQAWLRHRLRELGKEAR